MRLFLEVIDSVNKWIGYLLYPITIPMVLIGTYGVAMRYVFGIPINWVWEVNGFLMLLMTAMIGGHVELYNKHIRVDIIYSRFSLRTKAVLDLIGFPIFFLYFALMSWFSFDAALQSIRIKEFSASIWGAPVFLFRPFLSIGILLLTLQVVATFIRNLSIVINGKKLSGSN